jgi:uncharacterized protein (DUF427 family)
VRAESGGEVVLDSTRARLLHETNLPPQVYVPREDLRQDVLEHSDTQTHCPFKGDASYLSVNVGDSVTQDVFWSYEDPIDEAAWLRGYVGVYFDRLDRWLDEDEEILGHLRDPFHRIDVRATSRNVVVRAIGTGAVIAESSRPLLLSETGLANRFYLDRGDVSAELRRSERTTICPYKGTTTYWSVELGDGTVLEDAAWSYDDPVADAVRIAGRLSFDAEGLEVVETA